MSFGNRIDVAMSLSASLADSEYVYSVYHTLGSRRVSYLYEAGRRDILRLGVVATSLKIGAGREREKPMLGGEAAEAFVSRIC
jgi:hypothetical protein